MPGSIRSMYLEHVLRDVQTDRGRLLHGRPPSVAVRHRHLGTQMPSGGVHPITHLLEQKTDIRIIQVLLGHKKLDTTALYTRVAVSAIGEVTSPLDLLLKMPG